MSDLPARPGGSEAAGAALRAGVARIELPCRIGQPMMGYGARVAGAEAQHDPLYARALYLESGPLDPGRALLVECDLCLMGVAQARAVRERVASQTGLRVDEILVGCIHTHSGPDAGIAAVLAGAAPTPEQRALLTAVEKAACEAVHGAVPARLAVGRTHAHIGRNRRREGAAIDEAVEVLRVDDASGAPLAVAYAYGCHPTVLGHDNLAYSADWPGQAALEIEAALPGAVALFLLGAHGDVDPRTRGLLDLAIDGQSLGEGFDVVALLGREVGRAVVEAARRIEPSGEAVIRAASRHIELEVHGGCDERRRRHLETLRSRALEAVGLPPDAQARTAELYRLERRGVEGQPAEIVRERVARVRAYLRDRSAPRIAGAERVSVEVQCLWLGPLCLLALPIEMTSDVGLAWKAAAPSARASVVSIANGWLRYLPARSHFDEPDGHLQYEVLQATFSPDAADLLLAAGRDLARALFSAAAGPGSLPGISH